MEKHANGRHEPTTRSSQNRDGGCTITTKRILRSTPKTRSEPTIRRHGVVSAKKCTHHATIEETRLQENGTIQLGTQQQTSKMRPSQSNTFTSDTQESPEWVQLVPTSEMGPHEGWGDPIKIEVIPTSPEESRMDDALESELQRATENAHNSM